MRIFGLDNSCGALDAPLGPLCHGFSNFSEGTSLGVPPIHGLDAKKIAPVEASSSLARISGATLTANFLSGALGSMQNNLAVSNRKGIFFLLA